MMACSSSPQTHGDPDAPDFIPVSMARKRHDGWTPERQLMFIKALGATGSAAASAKMVGMSRKSAYALRNRADAQSFGEAWDIAIGTGRARMFDYMFDRAINGVTTIRLKMGGAVEIGHGMDRNLVANQLKMPLQGHDIFKPKGGSKGDKR